MIHACLNHPLPTPPVSLGARCKQPRLIPAAWASRVLVNAQIAIRRQPMRSCEISHAEVDPANDLAIMRVLALYGHLVDTESWDDLGAVFTADCVFEASVPGRPIWRGLSDLAAAFAAANRPAAHHTTNMVVEAIDGDRARSSSKWLVVPRAVSDPVRSGDYVDTFVRTTQGWRIARRVATERERTSPSSVARA